jgi:decaprenylphospho-beta-D-erythro-pentofuranosid-2-ulose 2-reductase
MKKIMIVGATSAIAQATARLFAKDGDALFLVARDVTKLENISDDLKTRGACKVFMRVMDALEFDRHEAIVEEAATLLDGIDIALIAYGSLPDQIKCQASFCSF